MGRSKAVLAIIISAIVTFKKATEDKAKEWLMSQSRIFLDRSSDEQTTFRNMPVLQRFANFYTELTTEFKGEIPNKMLGGVMEFLFKEWNKGKMEAIHERHCSNMVSFLRQELRIDKSQATDEEILSAIDTNAGGNMPPVLEALMGLVQGGKKPMPLDDDFLQQFKAG